MASLAIGTETEAHPLAWYRYHPLPCRTVTLIRITTITVSQVAIHTRCIPFPITILPSISPHLSTKLLPILGTLTTFTILNLNLQARFSSCRIRSLINLLMDIRRSHPTRHHRSRTHLIPVRFTEVRRHRTLNLTPSTALNLLLNLQLKVPLAA